MTTEKLLIVEHRVKTCQTPAFHGKVFRLIIFSCIHKTYFELLLLK